MVTDDRLRVWNVEVRRILYVEYIRERQGLSQNDCKRLQGAEQSLLTRVDFSYRRKCRNRLGENALTQVCTSVTLDFKYS